MYVRILERSVAASGLSNPIILSTLARAYLSRSYTLEAQTYTYLKVCMNSDSREPRRHNGPPTNSRGATSPAPAICAFACDDFLLVLSVPGKDDHLDRLIVISTSVPLLAHVDHPRGAGGCAAGAQQRGAISR